MTASQLAGMPRVDGGSRYCPAAAEDRADGAAGRGDRRHDLRRVHALRRDRDHRLARPRPVQLLLCRGGRRIHAGLGHDDRRRHRDRRAGAFHIAPADPPFPAGDAARDPCRDAAADRRLRRARLLVRHSARDREQRLDLAGAGDQPRLALCRPGGRRRADRALRPGGGIRAVPALDEQAVDEANAAAAGND